MLKLYFITIALFVFGCQTNNLVKEMKDDYASEKKTIIFNKNEKNKNKIPFNGMIMVKHDDPVSTLD